MGKTSKKQEDNGILSFQAVSWAVKTIKQGDVVVWPTRHFRQGGQSRPLCRVRYDRRKGGGGTKIWAGSSGQRDG